MRYQDEILQSEKRYAERSLAAASADGIGYAETETQRDMSAWEQARHDQKDALGELHEVITVMMGRLQPITCERAEKLAADGPRIELAHSEVVSDMHAVTDGIRHGITRIRELTFSLDL